MPTLKVAGGLSCELRGRAEARLLPGPAIHSVGWEAADFGLLRPRWLVKPGERVRGGQPLLSDRRRPEILYVAPVSGALHCVESGPQRRLQRLEILCDASIEVMNFAVKGAAERADALRELLLRSGLWPALRARPYGRVPDPAARPAAIFVQAIDTQPLAADPSAVIAAQQADFERGLQALCLLGEGPVFVCQSAAQPWVAPGRQIRPVRILGRHPAGLPGSSVHRLFPAGRHEVWEIHCQEVIAIGYLLREGRLLGQRWISVAGAAAATPALYALPPGAALAEVASALGNQRPTMALSGSPLHGRSGHYLGRRNYQISLLGAATAPARRGWRDWFRSLAASTAMFPLERLDKVFPFAMPATPLLRALSVGDVETAVELGALELLEEDLDVLSQLCVSGRNYGALLRGLLDEWELG